MFRDAQTNVWEAAALTTTAVSTNAVDLGAPGVASTLQRDPSVGEPLVFILTVGVAAKVSGTTETYEFDVVCADDNALSVNLTTLAQYAFTNAQAAAILVQGAIINLPVPPGAVTRRFLGLKLISANTPTITVTSWLAPASMSQMTRNYGTLIQIL